MIRFPRFLWEANKAGGEAGGGGEDPLPGTPFGGIETSARPDLAPQSTRNPVETTPQVEETPAGDETQPAEPPAETETSESASEDRPDEATEKEVGDTPDEARETAPENGEEVGRDHELPDELRGIFAKYQTPEGLAKAVKELQGLQNATALEKKDALAKLDRVTKFIAERFDETPTGEYVPKAEFLERHGAKPPAQEAKLPDEKAVRREIEKRFKKSALDSGIAEEDLDAVVDGMKSQIDDMVQTRMENLKAKAQANEIQERYQVGAVVSQFFDKHPEWNNDEMKAQLDAVFERFPKELQGRALLEGWVDLEATARHIDLGQRVVSDIQKAYELGMKHGKSAIEPGDGATPSSGGGEARPRGAGDVDTEAERYREAILSGSQLPSIETLFSR